jgi:hypothetical protein
MAKVGDGHDVHSVVSHDPRYLSEWRVCRATHDARVHAITHADLVTGHQTTAVSGSIPPQCSSQQEVVQALRRRSVVGLPACLVRPVADDEQLGDRTF